MHVLGRRSPPRIRVVHVAGVFTKPPLQDHPACDPGQQLHSPQEPGDQGRAEAAEGAGLLLPRQAPT